MRKSLAFLLTLLGITVASPGLAQSARGHAHVHGVATLDVAVDGDTLVLGLQSPLDSLLGFEHRPRNDKEKAAVQTMANTLRQPAELFVLPIAAQCRSTSVTLQSPVLEAGPGADGDGHADLHGEFVFQCVQPRHLTGMTVQLFKAFPHLKRVDVQIATPHGQNAARLSPQRNQLRWQAGRS